MNKLNYANFILYHSYYGTHEKITEIVLKLEHFRMQRKHSDGISNNLDTDQTAPERSVRYHLTRNLIIHLLFVYLFFFQIGVADGILNIVGNAETNESSLANMTGLLGNNDGNIDNDFEARNGTLFSINSTEEELWYFGTSCTSPFHIILLPF